MRNQAFGRLEGLIGDWELTMSNAWWRDDPEEEVGGRASFEWLDDIFVVYRFEIGELPPALCVIGYSDPRDQYYMLYHDDRGVARVFEMELSDQGWTLLREDADFYQRFQAELAENLITGASEASEDKGLTWRKDFDLVFTRSG